MRGCRRRLTFRDRHVPCGVDLGPVRDVLARIYQVVKDVGIPDVWSGHGDVIACWWADRGDEAAKGRAVGRERQMPVLRNDLHDQMRPGMAGTLLVAVGRGEQAAVCGVDT